MGGVIFAPDADVRKQIEKQGATLYLGLTRWVDAGSPTKAVVYDFAGTLADLHIPILDAVYCLGMYHRSSRIHGLQEIKTPKQEIHTPKAVPHKHDDKHTTERNKVVMVSAEATAAASGLGKMSRGAGHRAKKKAKK